MSEYQAYEFVALDRPLSKKDMAELRAISTRAEISSTRFFNEYQWGDLGADPAKLLARYFDAHLYFTNWGTRRLMLRLPRRITEERSLRPYFRGESKLTKSGSYLLLDFFSDTEEPEDDFSECQLAPLVPLRAMLLDGDRSAAYLAWLRAAETGELEDSVREPAMPDRLWPLSAPLLALAEFLRSDVDWVRAAADGSDRPRTVSELRVRAEIVRDVRRKEEEKRTLRARARAEAAKRKRLAAIAPQGKKAWAKLERLVDEKSYDAAVRLTVDLFDLARQSDEHAAFKEGYEAIRKKHIRRRGYLDAVKLALARAKDGPR